MPIPQQRLERAFSEALSWTGFLELMKVNRATIEANFQAHKILPAELQVFSHPLKPFKVLALVHDWCGDVVANLPIFARLEQAGVLSLSILEKNPHNTDLGLLYPHRSGEVHIPIYIVLNAEGRELGHFIERSPAMDKRMEQWIDDFWSRRPGHPESKRGFAELSEATRGELLEWLNQQRQAVRTEERQEILAWLAGLGG
ncbi:MAG: hypothetical protein HKM06_04855 [Spirochaetales bacterium]|nr:hypothetical protein [Spirochaetales bacterium]